MQQPTTSTPLTPLPRHGGKHTALLPVIEHSPSQPLHYRIKPNLHLTERRRRGVLLRFRSQQSPPCGTRLELQIPLHGEVHTFHGEVTRSEPSAELHAVEVWINHREESFAARMVEQLCHIAYYRLWVVRREGRYISEEQAADEWISRFAADFPAL